MWKFGSLPKPSMLRIEHAESRLLNRSNDARGNPPAAPGKRLRLRNRALDHLRLFHHVAILFFVAAGNAEQYSLETRTSVAVCRRKIRPALKRFAIGSKKSRKRPAALPADRTHRSLIPAVNVRTLVAVHLHRDEMLIHNRRHFRVVVGLAIHHMAPVAPYRPNVEQDRLVLALRGGKRLLAPLMPLNRLGHGRAQIGGMKPGRWGSGGGGHDYFSLYPVRGRDLPCVTLCPLWLTILCRPLLESNLPARFRTYCRRRRAAVALRPRLSVQFSWPRRVIRQGGAVFTRRPCRMA